ncbi:hypothetical protein ACP70R_027430 [Stipagrostis hirtigluma subsp. patula]
MGVDILHCFRDLHCRGAQNCTYDGVYMRYLRGGNTWNIHFGTSSKLQWPILFMKSM